MKRLRKLEFDICNKISYSTASNEGIRKKYSLSLEPRICLVYSIIDFFQLLQLCQVQEFETVAHSLWVLPTSAAELCLVVFFLPCSSQGNRRVPSAARLAVAFMWLLGLPTWQLGQHTHFNRFWTKPRGKRLAQPCQCFLDFCFLMYSFINIRLLNACFPKLSLDVFLLCFFVNQDCLANIWLRNCTNYGISSSLMSGLS